MRPARGDSEAGVALVPDPRVPVVVVAAAFQPLGQRRGGRRHHRAARGGQAVQHGVRVPRVRHGDQVAAVGRDPRPGLFRRRPGAAGVRWLIRKITIRNFQNELVRRPFRQLDRHSQPAIDGSRLGGARPAEPRRAAAPGPDAPVPLHGRGAAAPVPAPHVEEHRDLGRPVHRLDAAQQHRPARVGRHGERLPALGRGRADPPAVPDQGAVLVVAAPHVPGIGGGDGVPARAAEQRAERGGTVPARHAQPRDRAVRRDQGAALAVGDERVLAQHAGSDECLSHVVAASLVWDASCQEVGFL